MSQIISVEETIRTYHPEEPTLWIPQFLYRLKECGWTILRTVYHNHLILILRLMFRGNVRALESGFKILF